MPRIRSTEWLEPGSPTTREGTLRVQLVELNESDKDLVVQAIRDTIGVLNKKRPSGELPTKEEKIK